MLFIGFGIWILIWFILLTKETTEVFIKASGILFFWFLFMLLTVSLISVNNKSIDYNYKEYNTSINNLWNIISHIQHDVQKCNKVKWFKQFNTLVCKNWISYIKESNFNDVVISLQTYFKEYGKIHNFKNLTYILKYLKDKNMSIEKNFLYYKPIKNDKKKANKKTWK